MAIALVPREANCTVINRSVVHTAGTIGVILLLISKAPAKCIRQSIAVADSNGVATLHQLASLRRSNPPRFKWSTYTRRPLMCPAHSTCTLTPDVNDYALHVTVLVVAGI